MIEHLNRVWQYFLDRDLQGNIQYLFCNPIPRGGSRMIRRLVAAKVLELVAEPTVKNAFSGKNYVGELDEFCDTLTERLLPAYIEGAEGARDNLTDFVKLIEWQYSAQLEAYHQYSRRCADNVIRADIRSRIAAGDDRDFMRIYRFFNGDFLVVVPDHRTEYIRVVRVMFWEGKEIIQFLDEEGEEYFWRIIDRGFESLEIVQHDEATVYRLNGIYEDHLVEAYDRVKHEFQLRPY